VAKPKTFLIFHHEKKSASGKTDIYSVKNLSGQMLGGIFWYSQWRKYIFHSRDGISFDSKCLSEIVNFLNQLMEKRQNVISTP
jgi:hypothetical protein